MQHFFWSLSILFCLATTVTCGQDQSVTHSEDVIYGRKHGTALTLDVFEPKENRNGLGLIFAVSGGWFSSHSAVKFLPADEFCRRGYTVFAVVHGSQPKFTIPEVLEDMHRAVRFVRHSAGEYQVDPQRLGIYGGSAGGHLSVMQGVLGADGDPKAADPVDRDSSRVQAVACFYPPTDFLNYGADGVQALGEGVLVNFKAPFDFQEFDQGTRSFKLITDPERRRVIGRQISPAYHVTPDDAPTLIIHGDADKLVPIQQAELIMKHFEAANVPHKLVVKPGAVHGWPNLAKDLSIFADWFDEHLKKKD